MKFEKINIGLLIEQKMNELGVSKSEMARRSGIANQNINRVLERTSIDTDKLVAISEALNFNFLIASIQMKAIQLQRIMAMLLWQAMLQRITFRQMLQVN